ncbi:acyl-CoA reductase [Mycobacterium arosiense]|uniref:Acyl-CoA reductase n=1 Tax=Mycobacterium arosiense ATCC BAA-1401 = DSM 45069 TaxID=1265311 RepID=A0A1W9Z5T7_MYCAI|nr:acyl-CoA reductase [Mycobacterium arosiense]ORA07617.1 long-chain-fatty-acyl-CoA reductase [Mycobacterium arosiense ATCC BAA-1401 = DSM 45069]
MADNVPVVPLILRGQVIFDDLKTFNGRGASTFRTPDLQQHLNRLPLPHVDGLADLQALSTREIVDFLAELGTYLDINNNVYLQRARHLSYDAAPTTPPIIDEEYRLLTASFGREVLQEVLGDEAPYLDGWIPRTLATGQIVRTRAFGARAVHVIAGNSPLISALTIIRSALTRSDSIIKSPSNDPYTAAALVQTMCDVAPDHPVTRHISVAYWKGGDDQLEERIYHPSNVEKVLAWGGMTSVRHVTKYVQPGLELISFDPKRSCSVIGPAAFCDPETLVDAAHRLALDIGQLNQVGCVNARLVYVMSGTDDDGIAKANTLGQLTYSAMLALPPHLSTTPKTFDAELKAELEAIRPLGEWYRVIGGERGEGAIVISQLPEPVGFAAILNCRVANFVPVDDIGDIMRYMDAYTQTVGVYPEALKEDFRDTLPLVGVQRLVTLGFACAGSYGTAQDGMEPVRRMLRWIVDEDSTGLPVAVEPTDRSIDVDAESAVQS